MRLWELSPIDFSGCLLQGQNPAGVQEGLHNLPWLMVTNGDAARSSLRHTPSSTTEIMLRHLASELKTASAVYANLRQIPVGFLPVKTVLKTELNWTLFGCLFHFFMVMVIPPPHP